MTVYFPDDPFGPAGPSIDDIVKKARGRISAMRIAPPAGLESSRAAADEFECAIDACVRGMPADGTLHFHETIARVEERFRKKYDSEKAGGAKTESQMEEAADQVSTGWWIVLSRAGVAIRVGAEEPDFKAGDTVIFNMQRMPRKT